MKRLNGFSLFQKICKSIVFNLWRVFGKQIQVLEPEKQLNVSLLLYSYHNPNFKISIQCSSFSFRVTFSIALQKNILICDEVAPNTGHPRSSKINLKGLRAD